MKNQSPGFIIGIIIGLALTFVLFQNGMFPSKSITQPKLPSTTNQVKNPTIEIPIPMDDPVVKLAGVTYNLQGKIDSIKPVTGKPNEWEIDLVGVGGKQTFNNLFFVTPTTQVTSSATTSAKLKAIDLKPGDKIILNYFYDPIKKKGFVTSIQLTN